MARDGGAGGAASSNDRAAETRSDTSDQASNATSETTITTEAPAVKDGVLTIGGLFPTTGDEAQRGPAQAAGARLAVDDINQAGGVLDRDVVYNAGDAGDSAPGDAGAVASATVDRFVGQDVDVVVGAGSSAVSLAVIDKITEAGLVHFGPADSASVFADYADSNLHFRTAPPDQLQADALVGLLAADEIATLTLVAADRVGPTGLSALIRDAFTQTGGQTTKEALYDPTVDPFDGLAAEVLAAGADAIVVIGEDESHAVVEALLGAGASPGSLYVSDGTMAALRSGVEDPTVLAGIRGTIPAVDVSSQLPAFADRLLLVDETLSDFRFAAASYDAVIISALAALTARSDDPALIAPLIADVTRVGKNCSDFATCAVLVLDGEDIDYDGISGPLDLDDSGEPTRALMTLAAFGPEGIFEVLSQEPVSIGS